MDSFFDTILPEPVQPAPPPPPPAAQPLTAADIRQKMIEIIAALRGATELPFETKLWQQHKAMFPIMAQWLDPADGDALKAEFNSEAARFV